MTTTSSTHNNNKPQQQIPNMYSGSTSAPPPTPSTQPTNLLSTSSAADTLSRLLHRLPLTLSLPTRRSPPATSPPTISFSDHSSNPDFLNHLLSSCSQQGFFQLTNHSIPSELVNSAELEALSLFDLPTDQKESCFPKNWPLGYEVDQDNEEGDINHGLGESFCLDESCSVESPELSLASLIEFARALEEVGLKIVELLSNSVGFDNPLGKDQKGRSCSMMWVSECLPGNKLSGGSYPYIVGLQYQIRSQKQVLLTDSGWVSVLPQVDSVIVTLGDIAQVWSNGKLKKVRGRAVKCFGENENNKSSRCISMTLLVTLPLDSVVSPQLLIPIKETKTTGGDDYAELNYEDELSCDDVEMLVFNSFPFEDYAWRVYHESLLHFKDPLDRYRIKSH